MNKDLAKILTYIRQSLKYEGKYNFLLQEENYALQDLLIAKVTNNIAKEKSFLAFTNFWARVIVLV